MTSTGTLMFISPEILKGDKYSLPSDVFSFAMTLWELWNEEHPYFILKLIFLIFLFLFILDVKIKNNFQMNFQFKTL